ncbi:MAG TPA: Crp/Fnr family transcriptional regulator [Candidatus Kapabacteria bacterium]|nr:Crp/Fnr family transcriptional regulator [Candidatus Kapabacteria bacterium]
MDTLFHDLLPSEREILSASKRCTTVAEGKTIIHCGQRADTVHFVLNGRVKISLFGKNGMERIIRMASGGDILDYYSAISGDTYTIFARALEQTDLCSIPSDIFQHLVRSNGTFALRIISFLSGELMAAADGMMAFMQQSVPERLAHTLLDLNDKYGVEPDGRTMRIVLTRVDLAKIAGTTTESVSRTLSRFQRDGLIELVGPKIRIMEQQMLSDIAQTGY